MGKISNALNAFGADKGLKHFFKSVKDYIVWKTGQNKKRSAIQKKGFKIIEKVQSTLSENDVFFFFDMGTLLGIIREGGFIKHDLDIDIAVRVSSEEEKDRIKDLFAKIGAEECYRYTVDELGIVEQSFSYLGVKFDINYYVTDGENDYCYLMYKHPEIEYVGDELSVVKLGCPHINNLVLHKFGKIMINVPENAEEYLANRYGENWRIPDKKYIYWRGPSTTPTEYVGYKTEILR